jgi:hypothetical protein
VNSEATMNAVPWSTLGAGDTVRIHAGTVYHKQILISTSGTASQPIRVCGVSDGSGNLPELSGANATAKAGENFGTAPYSLQGYSGVLVNKAGTAYYGGQNYPKYIIIEGLKLSGYHQSNIYADVNDGVSKNYVSGAAAIRINRGGYITLRGNDISGCGNGYFTMSNNGVESYNTRNLLIEGNYFHGNGNNGSYLEHQNYLQAHGLVVQGNYYGNTLTGMLGSQFKARTVQQFVRYNYFEPAARVIDLVPVQDSPALVFPWVGLDAGELVNTSASDVVANYEAYQNAFVYGNIIHNRGISPAGWVIHYAADSTDQEANPGGTLYFYNNTINLSVISGESPGWRSGIVDLGVYGTPITTHTIWPTARLTNNDIHIRNNNSGPVFFWNRFKSDRVILYKNWVSTGWGTGDTSGGDGTGISNTNGENLAGIWQGGFLNTQVTGVANLIADTTLPFNATTYVPNDGGPLLSASTSLPDKAAALPALMQYSPVTGVMSLRPTARDIGAVEYVSGSPSKIPSPVKSIMIN